MEPTLRPQNNEVPPSQKSRRRLAPILVAALFFIAACGISVDFFAGQMANRRAERLAERSPANTSTALNGGRAIHEEKEPNPSAVSDDVGVSQLASNGKETSSEDLGRMDSTLPEAVPWPEIPERKKRSINSEPLPEVDEEIAMARGHRRQLPEVSFETPPEDLKISLGPSSWKGGPQILPDPMFVSQLREKGSLDIRGGGWLVVDIAQSKIVPVELFKAPKRAGDLRRVIEAKYVDGRDVVNPTDTGFPIIRGVYGMQPGGFEVFENPPCLVRYTTVNEEEICEVTLRNAKYRYKFSPPVLDPKEPVPDFIFSSVYLETARGQWKKIISFNESFHPIGDVNRDGAPDFYVKSVTAADESGTLTLLLSNQESNYTPYNVRFRSH